MTHKPLASMTLDNMTLDEMTSDGLVQGMLKIISKSVEVAHLSCTQSRS